MKLCLIALTFVFCLCTVCSLVSWDEELELTAASTSLRIGESVQLIVKKKGYWFRSHHLEDASKTTYATTSESALVVEPDGKVTCVGTYSRNTESAVISAWNGRSHGHLTFDLLEDGTGPTLDVTADSAAALPENARSQWGPCCSKPLVLNEGQQLKYTIRAHASGRDLTSIETGTKYTLFFGSGVPNDSRPSIITGGPDYVTVKSFLLDNQTATITAPDSIGRLNRARVIMFVRNGNLVGWREVVIIHPGGRLGGEQSR